jgi:ferredoxin-NADP reductase
MPAEDGLIELHVRSVDGGPVSGALVQHTQPGDQLRLGPPVGDRLTLAPGGSRDLVLIAGGTGLAPMKALIEQVAAEGGGRHVQLFWGTRWSWELYDLDALGRLAAGHDWLQIVPCVSVETGWGDGVRDTAVAAALSAGPGPDHEIYVCGSPAMVRGTVDGLHAAEVPGERIHFEDFGDEEELR